MCHDVTCGSPTPYFQPHGSKNVFLLTEIQIAIVFVLGSLRKQSRIPLFLLAFKLVSVPTPVLGARQL